MSERPEKPQNDPIKPQGGWNLPREASPWQTPEQATQPSVEWRTLKALPDDMDTAPEKRGDWHLPQAEDTSFKPEDQITLSPTQTSTATVVRPEDLLAEIVGQKRAQAALRPEDMIPQTRRKEEETVAATPKEGDTLLVDEEDSTLPVIEDDEELTMSEYMALASLAQGMDKGNTGTVNLADLSPAERALLNVASQAASELPKSAEPAVDTGATVTMQDTSQQSSQAADYARQQLAQLQSGPGEQPSFTQAPTVPQYTPEQIQLANQFRETKRQVQILRQMEAQGQIGRQELESRLQQFTILDQQGNWWMVGYDSDQWYRYNNANGQWELAQPPVPLDAGLARTETGVGAVAPDVMAGSLPYLPDSGQKVSPEEFSGYDGTQYSQAQQQYSQQYGIQDTPIPKPGQPTYDPNLTVVGSAVDESTLPYAQPTMQGLNYVDEQATVASAAAFPGNAYDDPYAAQDVIAQPRPIATGLEDPNLNIPAPDFEAQSSRQLSPLAIAGIIVGIIFLCGVGLAVSFLVYVNYEYTSIVSEWQDEIDALGSAEYDFQTARILAADGSVIAEITGEEGARTLVSIENGEVSPFFIHAVVSSEDPRFYENPGVDFFAIVRAYLQNLSAGEVVSGASTITQQIVRDRVLGSNLVTFDRKLTEAFLALAVAETYSKNEILDIYINEFFFGEQTYGVEAASEFYFGVHASELNAAQAATLVGILPAPSSTNPVVAPLASFGNMRVVLNRMIEVNCLNFQHGQWADTGTPFCINSDTLVNDGGGGQTRLFLRNPDGTFGGALAVQIAQVETRRYEPRQSDILYPHFVYYVLGELDAAYGRGAYIDRGFTVYTTLDPRMQDAAEGALDTSVDSLRLSGAVTGGIVVMEPQTGAIRVMVGSPDFNNVDIDGQNNNTISLQQPGSAIKPVLYTAALMGGPNGAYNPATILWDVPTRFTLSDGSTYSPTNFDNRTRGPIPMRYALQQSLNIPAVKTYAFLGGEAFVTTANAMGINFDNPYDDLTPTFGLPTAIGATEVTLLDLTHAYATIANDGIFTPTYVVDRITETSPNRNQVEVELIGNLVHNTQLQVVTPQVAYLMQNILSDENARIATLNGVPAPFPANSPISGASLGLPNQGVLAAKTGTNNTANGNPSRIWTVGFTNNYAAGVWVGTLNQATPMTGGVSGLAGAAPAWNTVMRAALNGRNPGPFQVPATGVVQQTVCFLTGAIATDNCPTRVNELFSSDHPPAAADQGFVTAINIDSWTGARANQWCSENVVTQTFANISDPFATQWLNNTQQGRGILTALSLPQNLPAAPSTECVQGAPLPTVRINFPSEGTTLLENVAITGQVSAENLNRWELQITEVGTDNFRSIMPAPSTSQVAIAGTTLFEWDSRTVQNGEYILRLAAFSNINGGYIFRDVRIRVQNIPPTPTPQPTSTVPAVDATLPFDPLSPTSTPDPFGN